MSANAIAEILFEQVEYEDHLSALLRYIVNHRVNGREVTKEHAFIILHNSGQRRKETTQGWEILIQWKDEYTTWEYLKDVKESYMVQLAEYARQCKFSDKPTFSWWVPHVINKQECIIAEVKSKYWLHTQTFGIRVPKMVEEAKRLDQ